MLAFADAGDALEWCLMAQELVTEVRVRAARMLSLVMPALGAPT